MVADYKTVLKQTIKERRARSPKYTLGYVAAKVDIQNSYLSRLLNNDEVDFSEEMLFSVCNAIEMGHDDFEYVSTLRRWKVTEHPEYKRRLEARIRKMAADFSVRAKREDVVEDLSKQIAYLKDPLCLVTHVALTIKPLREDLTRIRTMLGINRERLKGILQILEDVGYIQIEENGRAIKVKENNIHFGKDHPMMRAHQYIFQAYCLAHLTKIDEEDRENFLVTFSTDATTIAEIKKEFKEFISRMETKVAKSKEEGVYQLCFSLFPWIE
ncbi:MAG: TIGR02147 family protein [Oligoflexales bacterium]